MIGASGITNPLPKYFKKYLAVSYNCFIFTYVKPIKFKTMEPYMYEANEKFFDTILRKVREGGMFIWPEALAAYQIVMKKLMPADDRSYKILKDQVRPEWFSTHVINPNVTIMN
jgi:hypothetical protein